MALCPRRFRAGLFCEGNAMFRVRVIDRRTIPARVLWVSGISDRAGPPEDGLSLVADPAVAALYLDEDEDLALRDAEILRSIFNDERVAIEVFDLD